MIGAPLDAAPRKPLRVLHVEDSEGDSALVMRELRRGGFDPSFERVETRAAFKNALREKEWDVIISDYALPGYNGAAALADTRETGKDIPFILVSGTIGEETAVDAMRAGAHDYVLKNRLGRLAPAVARELQESKDRGARRLAEDALRESEGRFRRLAESGLVGIIVAEHSGKIVAANDAFLAMVGYSRDDLAAGLVSWARMTPPEWSSTTAAAAEQLRMHGVARPWEKEYICKDGSRVSALVGVATLEGGRNISLSIDLTERKQAEAGRARAEEGLRRSELQLRQAQKMEAVGRLAGGVAHDFNNVLSVILSYSELILADVEPGEPIRDDIEEIRKAGRRAAALTRQLLTFSHQQVLDPKVLDLNEVLVSMDKMLQRILGADVDLVLLPTRVLGRVRVDPSSIEVVIMNLVVNARDAMPTGGTLTIKTSNVVLGQADARAHLGVKPGPHVMLAVTDTGTGIDEAILARIFEPFFTTKAIGQGTGLGLSTVFGVAQQSGGSVWVDSKLGSGTTFRVYLPRVDAAVDGARVTDPPPATLLGSETILLVEDDDQVRVVARGILRRNGYSVVEARSAGEALLHSEKHPGTIQLLLSDVVMPQMSGPELANRLSSARPDMKVLCMSGCTDDSAVRQGILAAHIAYLQKPFTPDALTTRVREVLDGP
jgi:two-component system, cell cycle sensor histidine kinase and response regulator CckA